MEVFDGVWFLFTQCTKMWFLVFLVKHAAGRSEGVDKCGCLPVWHWENNDCIRVVVICCKYVFVAFMREKTNLEIFWSNQFRLLYFQYLQWLPNRIFCWSCLVCHPCNWCVPAKILLFSCWWNVLWLLLGVSFDCCCWYREVFSDSCGCKTLAI